MRPIFLALVASSLCASAIAGDNSKPVSFVCNFPKLQMSFTFVVTDRAEGKFTKATIVGNKGTDTVIAFIGASAVSFLEPLATGAVQSTTIQLSTLEAVHSRHTIMGFDATAEFMPSQSNGKCELRD